MRLPILFLFTLILLSCGTPDPAADAAVAPTQAAGVPDKDTYPAGLAAVMDAHGGLETWRNARTLKFNLPGDAGGAAYTVDLPTRRERVVQEGQTMGYDGTVSWVESEEPFEGDAKFQRNLMFYFYAMPFVLADPGIRYEETTPLEVDGVRYPGYKISYEDGVGLSSKDNYYLHYDPETMRMRWLGYTVTYWKEAPSDDVGWINYPAWEDVDGVLLPTELTWYTVEDGLPTAARSSQSVNDASLSQRTLADDFYGAPAGAEIFE